MEIWGQERKHSQDKASRTADFPLGVKKSSTNPQIKITNLDVQIGYATKTLPFLVFKRSVQRHPKSHLEQWHHILGCYFPL
jgi:hypothetical protein